MYDTCFACGFNGMLGGFKQRASPQPGMCYLQQWAISALCFVCVFCTCVFSIYNGGIGYTDE